MRPVIIVEGPDESGKTALTTEMKKILEAYDYRPDIRVSPAGHGQWSREFNEYVTNTSKVSSGVLPILERCPEISETVYTAAMHRNNRLVDPLESLKSLRQVPTFIVMCKAPFGEVKAVHHEGTGIRISEVQHMRVRADYDLITELLKIRTSTYHPRSRLFVYQYNDGTRGQKALFAELGAWLLNFPEMRIKV